MAIDASTSPVGTESRIVAYDIAAYRWAGTVSAVNRAPATVSGVEADSVVRYSRARTLTEDATAILGPIEGDGVAA